MPTRRLRPPLPVDLRPSLAPLWSGRNDPTMRLSTAHAVRAGWSPEGPVTVALTVRDGEVEAEAWGPGAAWALAQLPGLVGAEDDLTGFAPTDRLVARAHRRLPGLRVIRTGVVYDLLVPTILAQKVTGIEATRAWLALCRRLGQPAPGPHRLRLPPAPASLAAAPSWMFRQAGVDRVRAETIRRACRRLDRLEEAAALPMSEAVARLTAVAGIGPWTAARVLRVARGDADAVEVGDFHLPNLVCWALAGEPRGDDARMLALLEPYRGHRGRVARLLVAAGLRAPAYGPRMPVRPLPGTPPATRPSGAA